MPSFTLFFINNKKYGNEEIREGSNGLELTNIFAFEFLNELCFHGSENGSNNIISRIFFLRNVIKFIYFIHFILPDTIFIYFMWPAAFSL